ncbi:hypothetical protein NGRA_3125 [Nosema granulosis]|uniref:Uncharacterized protein n=1 Tax=Nosema granulosis TaxID=83296 RepID=A0A9P6GVC0_9MICR|nr:hypothetical protein NGRA_3125 [Nosema granulosis]
MKKININEMFITFKSSKLPPLPTSTSKNRKIKNINVQKLAKMFDEDYSDLEPISSDEEIYLNQLVEPVEDDHHLENQVTNDDMNQTFIQDLNNDDARIDDVPLINLNDDYIGNEIEIGGGSVDNQQVAVDQQNRQDDAKNPLKKKCRSAQAKKKQNSKRNLKLRRNRFNYVLTRRLNYPFKMSAIKKVLYHYSIKYVHVKLVGEMVVIGVKNGMVKQDYEHALPQDCFNKDHYRSFKK